MASCKGSGCASAGVSGGAGSGDDPCCGCTSIGKHRLAHVQCHCSSGSQTSNSMCNTSLAVSSLLVNDSCHPAVPLLHLQCPVTHLDVQLL